MRTNPLLAFTPITHVSGGRYPAFAETVLPVARLRAAARFYCGVSGLQRQDRYGRADFALLERGPRRLSLYAIPKYIPPTLDQPVLSSTLTPVEFDALAWRIREHGGRILREPNFEASVPSLLFTDPGQCNAIECRGVLSLSMASVI